MTKRGLVLRLGFLAGLFLIGVRDARAQFPAYGGRQVPNPYSRPPVLSPYINLLNGGNPAVNYFYGVRPGTTQATTMNTGPQMSQDGGFWWDGQAWRDATREVPPDALRSADGNWVWSFILQGHDGRTRLMSRNRFRLPRLRDKLGMLPMEPGSLVMERKMLRGIKQRSERLARVRGGVSKQVTDCY